MEQVFVLHLGREPALLETRSQILKNAGYSVIPASSVEAGLRTLRLFGFDVVLICHSVFAADRERFIRSVRKHNPLTPLVLVSDAPVGSLEGCDVTIENDPQTLVRKLPLVLQMRRGRVHRMNPS
jgi:CheY-like chemotaxis protein